MQPKSMRFSLAISAGIIIGAMMPAFAETKELTVVVPNPSAILYMPIAVAIGEGYFNDEQIWLQPPSFR